MKKKSAIINPKSGYSEPKKENTSYVIGLNLTLNQAKSSQTGTTEENDRNDFQSTG